ncbi:MAG: radical SAM protein [Acidaminobacter sp.]|uniref:elongator complex protein 3 n=1 Tax=Acidaminobacter sp. TaxID=1872102 RepID=UPI00137D8FF0|nr:radical SAM protein [Acidaminobacter sp.]MZQ96487.1 radical SAM protein [Acidaminobacter sp.]
MIIPVFIPHLGCPNQCVFCNQKTITGLGEHLTTVETARTEIEAWLARSDAEGSNELAFYGGSFTAIPYAEQIAYLELAEEYRQKGLIRTIRISTRPDAIDPDHLKLLKAYGVRRIELGAQSFDDRVLSMSQRGHSAVEIERAAKGIHEAGIDLGLQLMVGLPGDSPETDLKGISEAFRLYATTLRIYPALVLKGTSLEKLLLQGAYVPLSLDEAVERVALMMDAVDEKNSEMTQPKLELIRVGLQENEMLSGSGEVLAGPHHPAFRSLVDTFRFKTRLDQDAQRCNWRGKNLEVHVRGKDLSSFVGHQRRNLIYLKNHYGVSALRVVRDESVPAMRYIITITESDGR